jgi:predicted TIM-barrel fold metal-dependent hydrolase
MIVDVHRHVQHKDWSSETWHEMMLTLRHNFMLSQGEKVTLEDVRKEVDTWYDDPQADKLIESMDQAGIDMAVIFPVDWGLGMGEGKVSIEEVNRLYGEMVQRHSGRLVSFVAVDPRRPNAVELLEKGVREWGAKGLKIHPSAGFFPNDEGCYPLYRKAVELDAIVLTHTGNIIPPMRSKFTQPLYLDDVLIDFPELKLICAHLGFGWWQELSFLGWRRNNMYADISGWQRLVGNDFDTFCRALRAMLNRLGPDKVMFGTDGPTLSRDHPDGDWIELVRNLPDTAPQGISFTSEEVEGILGENAKQLLEL